MLARSTHILILVFLKIEFTKNVFYSYALVYEYD